MLYHFFSGTPIIHRKQVLGVLLFNRNFVYSVKWRVFPCHSLLNLRLWRMPKLKAAGFFEQQKLPGDQGYCCVIGRCDRWFMVGQHLAWINRMCIQHRRSMLKEYTSCWRLPSKMPSRLCWMRKRLDSEINKDALAIFLIRLLHSYLPTTSDVACMICAESNWKRSIKPIGH